MENKIILSTQSQTLTLNDPQVNAEKIFDGIDASEATRNEYKYRIKFFLTFIADKHLTHNSFLDFKRYLTDRTDFSVSTKNKYLATAKIFLRELHRQGMLQVDITHNIKTFSQDKKHKRDGLSEDEIKHLIIKLKELVSTPQNARLKAILALLALQGLRQVEVIRLDVKDIDLVAHTAFVRGKGRDDKELVSLHPETVKALQEYMKTNKKASGALFTSISNFGKGQRLTTRSIRKIVTGILKELGIEKSTHGFRHFFTTKLIQSYKGDLLEVAQYTRHRGLEMLQVYNDAVKKKADLPRYYRTFKGVSF